MTSCAAKIWRLIPASIFQQSTNIMIQRSLLRQSQAVCQKYRPQSSLLFHRAQFPPIRIASLQQKVSAKCYSTTGADIHASSEASPADSSPPNPSTAAEDTELDTKNREIIDLKVGLFMHTVVHSILIICIFRINTYVP